MRAYRVFSLEIRALKRFCESCEYAFVTTEDVLRESATGMGEVAPPSFSGPARYGLKKRFRTKVRRQLRELVFIRLVSVLEAYLVDTVRDVFVATKKPFMAQIPQDMFTQAELLSARSLSHIYSRIINRDCRKLGSGGFIEIMKYYKSHFDIDLAEIPPGKRTMREHHDRRHLLVHRLGRTDDQYRLAYGASERVLSVSEDYLRQSLDDFESYAQNIADRVAVLVHEHEIAAPPASELSRIVLRVSHVTGTLSAIFRDDFQFWVEDELFLFSDIVESMHAIGDRQSEVRLGGREAAIRTFMKHVRRGERIGDFTVTVVWTKLSARKKHREVDQDFLDLVAGHLPQQPWPTGIHKDVAKQLGVSNGKVSGAIQVLIERGVFKHQIAGLKVPE